MASPQLRVVKTAALQERLLRLYDEGMPPGESTGWASLDDFYTIVPGQFTLITGVPSHGKTSWLDALLLNLARKGWRHAIYSPEQYPTEFHLAALAERLTGKRFGARFHNAIPEEQLAKVFKFLDLHFDLLELDEAKNIPTLDEVLDHMIPILERWESVGVEGPFAVVIDPWTELRQEPDVNGSETKYIGESLTRFRAFCRSWPAHGFIVAHPAKMARNKDGSFPKPRPYDIAGSAHWANKPDNIITVWRDTSIYGTTEIHVEKVRFKHVGKQGFTTLLYDLATGQYRDNDGRNSEFGDE